MIEIDPTIIDPQLLMRKVEQSVLEKNIPHSFYNETYEEMCLLTGNVDMLEIQQYLRSLFQNIEAMNNSWVISELPITTIKKHFGKLIIFSKKVFRKLTRWLFQAYFVQQVNFNGATTRAISDMLKIQEKLIKLQETKCTEE